MRKSTAAAGAGLFFALAPGVVAGLIPAALTHWRVALALPWPVRLVGAALAVAGASLLVHAFVRFVVEGSGTPAPVAPTERLVVGGAYRYVRNPMYVAVLAVIVGQAIWFGSWALVGYAAVVAAAFVTFVRVYEQPTLLHTHGEQYRQYLDAVPGWFPSVRPWSGPR